jgi:hypothetical protein
MKKITTEAVRMAGRGAERILLKEDMMIFFARVNIDEIL